MPELSEAGARFGRSMCLSDDRIGLPLAELTPDERSCVEGVGLGWQGRVEERLAATGGAQGPTPDMFIKVLRGGEQVGSLRLVEGAVTLCIPMQSCEVVGHGLDGLAAAESTLNHMGLSTEVLT